MIKIAHINFLLNLNDVNDKIIFFGQKFSIYHHRRREDLCTCSLASIYLGILYEKKYVENMFHWTVQGWEMFSYGI